jgi:hypothetical protein
LADDGFGADIRLPNDIEDVHANRELGFHVQLCVLYGIMFSRALHFLADKNWQTAETEIFMKSSGS